ncbi:phenolic glucoside malonyltransferase 1-like [Musa acuminata AAA Group]|uniref:phenolic glucoside malonyltransferase 1-like n=1 Tax=Musa acuminata AAA Group TaxID=214697 RepID=UPI0031E2E402
MASLPAFRVLVITISIAESTLPLTFFDIAWENAGAVERVFFYHISHSTSDFFDSILPDLKSSLSLALQQFYPLAGKICHPLDKYEIHYADGGGVRGGLRGYLRHPWK